MAISRLPSDSVETMTIRFGFFLYNPFPVLSITSAVESIRAANAVTGRELYSWKFYTLEGEEAYSDAGLIIRPHARFEDAGVDVMMLAASNSAMHCRDGRLFSIVRRIATRGTRMGAVSGGPIFLARAGLLEGRRYTAHWEHGPALLEEFPHLDFRRSLYEVDGPRFTCAGGVAVLDMMNTLISTDYGPEIAQHASDFLLQTHVRGGDDSHRMSVRQRLDIAHPNLIKAIDQLGENLDRPLDRDEFAKRLGLSVRHLERLFATRLQTTINKYHMKLRMEQARILIKQSTLSLTEISIATGFVNFSHFSRVYKKTFGLTPRDSRKSPTYR